jgi:hypothetical protein
MKLDEDDIRHMLDSENPQFGDSHELGMGAIGYLSKLFHHNRDGSRIAKGLQLASLDRGQYRPLCEAFILAATKSDKAEVRIAAARAANNLTVQSRDAVFAVLRDDPNPGVKRIVADVMKQGPQA